MDIDDEIPEADVIDTAFLDLIHNSPLGDNISDEDFDGAADVLYSIIGEFVDAGEMEEIPDNDETLDKKQQWLTAYLEKVKTEFLASVFLTDNLTDDTNL